MYEIHTSANTPPITLPDFEQTFAPSVERDPIGLAERLFGAAQHMILISDDGPSVAIMGWRLGTGRAEVAASDGQVTAIVEVDLMYDEDDRYIICERAESFPSADQRTLAATLTVCEGRDEVLKFFDQMSLDPVRDAACCAALDHVARFWPFLGRRLRRHSDELKLPFAL